MNKIRVMFVCLGNICRSPTAHGYFEKLIEHAGLNHCVVIESSGTSGWHIGEKPDSRTIAAAKRRGVDLTHLRGQQFSVSDLDHFDYILAMDEDNLHNILDLKRARLAGSIGTGLVETGINEKGSIDSNSSKTRQIGLFLDYSSHYKGQAVPDPYHGGAAGFEQVLDMVEEACQGLLEQVKSDLAGPQ